MATKATQTGTVEADGFTGLVYENAEKGTTFVSWQLAEFEAGRGPKVRITGVTGEGAGPRAAAWNLQHASNRRYLRTILASRIQVGGADSGIRVHVPGAKVQVSGYEDPLELKLESYVDGRGDIGLALGLLAENLARVVARGVYARTQPARGDEVETEAGTEDIEEIPF